MSKIILNFPNSNKQYYSEIDQGLDLKYKDQILVKDNQIIELAEIYDLNADDKITNLEIFEGKILRKITLEDQEKIKENKDQAVQYLADCQEIINSYQMPMKLVDADLSFDGKKITFYFGSEGRIDFRQLVADLIKKYKKLIRLQQIGARDEAKILGGYGKCGRVFCCKNYLKKVDSVTLDMARDQGLTSGIGKISGACGKLMCCLANELEMYQKLKKKLPEIGTEIKTKQGKGRVIEQKLLKSSVIVELDSSKEKNSKERVEVAI